MKLSRAVLALGLALLTEMEGAGACCLAARDKGPEHGHGHSGHAAPSRPVGLAADGAVPDVPPCVLPAPAPALRERVISAAPGAPVSASPAAIPLRPDAAFPPVLPSVGIGFMRPAPGFRPLRL
jgi:hypothetical protein